VPALANGDRDCDPWAGSQKDIVLGKTGPMFWYINVSLDEKLKWSIFIALFTFNQATRHVI
jgi:hypothetical protein